MTPGTTDIAPTATAPPPHVQIMQLAGGHIIVKANAAHSFSEAMIGFHCAEPPAVTTGYDISDIGTLVDVGGGTGNLLTTVLQAHPSVRGVLVPRQTLQPQQEWEVRVG